MRAIIQRVQEASVSVEGVKISSIKRGFLILLGITHDDGADEVAYLARKIAGLRLFEDEAGKLNLGLLEVGGEILVVSQFTLYGDVRKGRRPSFVDAARPDTALPLYEEFCRQLAVEGLVVKQGKFQAHMAVSLLNDGPVTIWLDTDSLMSNRN